MLAYRVETTVDKDGKLVLDRLPLQAGEIVEVIVLVQSAETKDKRYPLRGTPYTYVDPFEPAVPPEDWEANQ